MQMNFKDGAIMKEIYKGAGYKVTAGCLNEFTNKKKIDVTQVYNDFKYIIGDFEGIYPFSVTVFPDVNETELLINIISFIDSSFKLFSVYKPMVIFIESCLKRDDTTDIEEHVVAIIKNLDIAKILDELYRLNMEVKNVNQYILMQFSSLDYAAISAAILKNAVYSCLLKDKNNYSLIFRLSEKNAKTMDYILAQLSEYSSCDSIWLSKLQLQHRFEQGSEIIIKEEAIEKLNKYITCTL